MQRTRHTFTHKPPSFALVTLLVIALCLFVAGCDVSLPGLGGSTPSCQSNCTTGAGVQGVRVFVEPDAGVHPITDAIGAAKKSVWLEMYILSDRDVIRALEEAGNRGIDVRVMLEPHPFGSSPPSRTIDQLKAAGIKAQYSDPSFSLTHEKGMIIDGTTAYIMTSNFSRSGLGGYSSSSNYNNREYDIIDGNPQDVQAVSAIFQADWNHTTAQFSDPNLVVSPVNSRNSFT